MLSRHHNIGNDQVNSTWFDDTERKDIDGSLLITGTNTDELSKSLSHTTTDEDLFTSYVLGCLRRFGEDGSCWGLDGSA